MNIIARLQTIAESIISIGMRHINKTQDIDAKNQTSASNDNIICGNQDIGFNIVDAIKELEKTGNFICKQFKKNKLDESWIIMTPGLANGREIVIHINVTLQYDTKELILIMPMYDDGSEGLIGDKVESFYNTIHLFSSRTNGGFFTKYPYDETFAPVFMFHLPLAKMDYDLFNNTIFYYIKIYNKFRPRFDYLINEFELKFKKKAALEDPAYKYYQIPEFIAIKASPKDSQLAPISGRILERGWSSWNSTSERSLSDSQD